MSDRAFKKLDSLIMAITENACGNGSAEDVAEKREALESHIHGMQSRLDVLEKDAARYRLRLETIQALYPNAPSDCELDIAIDAAIQSQGATE